MAKTKTVEEFATALQEALGSRLVAFLLYGSAARGSGAHVPGRSDWNTLLIVDRVDDGLFAVIASAVAAWTQGGHPAPILLSDAEWRASVDVFAIEYEDMREAHRLLAGRDPWSGVTVQRADVRRQLEQELMVKLVRLRQAYASLRNDPSAWRELWAAAWRDSSPCCARRCGWRDASLRRPRRTWCARRPRCWGCHPTR
jgi:hypothetical protein